MDTAALLVTIGLFIAGLFAVWSWLRDASEIERARRFADSIMRITERQDDPPLS